MPAGNSDGELQLKKLWKGCNMSTKPTHMNGGDAAHEEIQPASLQKSPMEWSGFLRRREHAQPAPKPAVQREASNGAGLVVIGTGANIVGEITNCTQVEIAGSLEGKVVADALIIRDGGCLKGYVCARRAEVHGTVEGEVKVADHLDIRSTGDVSGELTYGKLSVASGGRLSGLLEIIRTHEQEHDEPAEDSEAHDEPLKNGTLNGAHIGNGSMVAVEESSEFDVWAGR